MLSRKTVKSVLPPESGVWKGPNCAGDRIVDGRVALASRTVIAVAEAGKFE